ncbi:MAG: MgtC/SapB family protein [Deltaproteobacteria bacterium]|nr:MgtC/SapB family protein [Deltaproteobacteria bacterium]
MLIEQLLPFLIAAALGFAIGLDRERRHFRMQSMGVRSFVLLGLLGALAGSVQNVYFSTSIALFVAAAIIVGYYRTSQDGGGEPEMGLTTEFAGAITFVLGYMAHDRPWLTAILGLTVFTVLWSRKALHNFSRHQVKPAEIQAALILLVLVIGIRPLLPEGPIDPWGIVHLKTFVTVIALILGIQFLSHILIQVFGKTVGVPLWGFLAGFISSTAVILMLPKLVKKDKALTASALAAALFASTSTFVLLLLIVSALSYELLGQVSAFLALSILISTLAGLFFAKRQDKIAPFPTMENPIAFIPAVKLALILSAIVLTVGFVNEFAGDFGTKVASFIGGLGELHGVTLSVATIFVSKSMTITQAKTSIMLAAVASIISKLVITWVGSQTRYAVYFSLVAAAMTTSILAAWSFMS